MGYNLAVFAWRDELSSHAARKKAGITFDDVFDAICNTGSHHALADADFTSFETLLTERLGSGDDAPYTLERYPRARVVRIAYSDVPRLVAEIGTLARKAGLTAAGER
ncbi:MAG: hypothetical protein U0165_04070 [Polyangiaceae bacterium]